MSRPNCKRQRLSYSRSYSDLPPELLELISRNLSGPDIARFMSVCSSWKKAAEGQQFRGAFLLLPIPAESSLSNKPPPTLQLMRGGTEVAYTLEKKTVEKLLNRGVCVGASHEWLFMVDEYGNFWLFNIFSGKEIQLPYFKIVTHVVDFDYERLPIEKALLSASPSYDENFKAVIIYGHDKKLWHCGGQRNKWTPLSNDGRCLDAVWKNDDNLYALNEGQIVVVFDFKISEPKKSRVFSPFYLERLKIDYDFIQYYLVVSEGDMLLIQRVIGDRVNGDGQIVNEEDLLPEDDEDGNNHPLVCPYRTLGFVILKWDLELCAWKEVESLPDDQAIVLGGNQTIALSVKNYPGIKKNSIYFSDNYWDRMKEDYLYGGHDNGIYDLETRSVEMFVDSNRFDPTPFWITIL